MSEDVKAASGGPEEVEDLRGDQERVSATLALAERMAQQARYSWTPQTGDFLQGCRLDHLDAAVHMRAAYNVATELQRVIDEVYNLLVSAEADEKSDRMLLATVTNKLADVATVADAIYRKIAELPKTFPTLSREHSHEC